MNLNLYKKKIEIATKALNSLEIALTADYSVFVRDSAIQRFEYTTEAFWKCIQTYLKEYEGVICASPKSCIREAMRNKMLNSEETELALEMIDDRNLTSHTYHEEVAEMLFKRLPGYFALMKKILNNLEQ
jgi:nucleotidyltransferase substrate binding protein (TIGR01987 family)